MNDAFRVFTPESDSDWEALSISMVRAFGGKIEYCREYFDKVGRENARAISVNGETAGGLVNIPMGQYFGGRRVPMGGIAAVTVLAQYRARGVAKAIMAQTIREMYEQGVPISALYPATLTLYRRVGYELAGCQYRTDIPLRSVEAERGSPGVREATDADQDLIKASYDRWACSHDGMLDRNGFMWGRVRKRRDLEAVPYIIEGDQGPEGHLYMVQIDTKETESGSYDLYLPDFVCHTAGAIQRAWAFLRDHCSVGGKALLLTSPHGPEILGLRERGAKTKIADQWMLRIVDVAAALEARGYAPEISAELDFEVYGDTVLGDVNHDRFRLRVGDSVGQVERGAGKGTMKIHVNGLASLYTGHLSAEALIRAGLLECEDAAAAARTTGVFRSSIPPFMVDGF